ncbi:hypothetical protein BGW42_006353, partial [Actinomortierella wolfii]
MAKADEPSQIAIKHSPRGQTSIIRPLASTLFRYRMNAKKRDHDPAALANRMAQATGPIDSVSHALLRDH